ncbi:hypothetical protein Emag_005386 [Eimeria magna]
MLLFNSKGSREWPYCIGKGDASLKRLQLLPVLLLLSLCASPVLPGVCAVATLEDSAPVSTLSEYLRGETETQKTEDLYPDLPLPYDTTEVEQLQQQVQELQQQMQVLQQQKKRIDKGRHRKQQLPLNQQTGDDVSGDRIEAEEAAPVVGEDERQQQSSTTKAGTEGSWFLPSGFRDANVLLKDHEEWPGSQGFVIW